MSCGNRRLISVGVDRLVRHAGARHRLAERGEMRRVGRAEIEAPALHQQWLSRLLAEHAPEREGGAGERDVVLALVGQPDDPGRSVRAPFLMPDAARLEQQHAPAVAREVVCGREPHQAATHDDDLGSLRHPVVDVARDAAVDADVLAGDVGRAVRGEQR